MNTPLNPPPESGWLEQSKRLLDESADGLDAATLSRLNRARQGALGQRRRRVRDWLPVGAVAACTMLVALMVANDHRRAHHGTPELPLAAQTESAGDVDLVSSDDSLEFYQDLEFYAWLEAQQQDQDLGS
jgi:hypothetical protein